MGCKRTFTNPMPRAAVDESEIARVEINFPSLGSNDMADVRISARMNARGEAIDGVVSNFDPADASAEFSTALQAFLGACMRELGNLGALPAGDDSDVP